MSKAKSPAAKKKAPSLAEKIAALSNPTPQDDDPEDQDVAAGFDARPIGDADDQEFSDEEPVRRSNLRQPIELGPQYAGKVVKRSQLRDEEEDGSEAEDNDEEEEDAEEEEDEEDGGDVEMDGGDDEDGFEDDQSGDDQDDGSEEDAEDGAESEKLKTEAAREQVLSQLKELQEQSERVPSTVLFGKGTDADGTGSDESTKALHVKNQRLLWEKMLDFRIRLQPLCVIANKLPDAHQIHSVLENSPPKVSAQFAAAADEVHGLVTDLLDLQHALHEQNPSLPSIPPFVGHKSKRKQAPPTPAAAEKNKKQRTKTGDSAAASSSEHEMHDVWHYLKDTFHKMEPYRRETIDRWNKRTEATTGSQALRSKSFKALNQSLLSQIDSTLSDMPTLIKRTQLKRSPQAAASADSSAASDETKQEHDPQIFDDTDFYQGILREIISSGLEFGSDQDRDLLSMAKTARKKSKKNVDRRASKGRKIRYAVMPKLVNFMAPIAKFDESFIADELFAGLFGAKPKPQSQPQEQEDAE